MLSISAKLKEIHKNIKHIAEHYQRNPNSILLLAISKARTVEEIRPAYAAGCCCFGESYIQEAMEKMGVLQALPLVWHFIGPIQSNKTQLIAKNFAWVHSIDRLKIAQRLNDQRDSSAPVLNVCIQVNISEDENKSGIKLANLQDLANKVVNLPRLKLRGLMTVPRLSHSLSKQRIAFHEMANALSKLNASLSNANNLGKNHDFLDTLSMGMSNDYPAAIAEGATIIRLGTALFGARLNSRLH